MICTNTDHYVNTLSTIKKEKKKKKQTRARKPKVPGWTPAASYVQRRALCSNCPANF